MHGKSLFLIDILFLCDYFSVNGWMTGELWERALGVFVVFFLIEFGIIRVWFKILLSDSAGFMPGPQPAGVWKAEYRYSQKKRFQVLCYTRDISEDSMCKYGQTPYSDSVNAFCTSAKLSKNLFFLTIKESLKCIRLKLIWRCFFSQWGAEIYI